MSERGYIDGILSTHYDECNIAAADAARLANELKARKADSQEVQPVGPYIADGLRSFEYHDITSISVHHEAVVDGQIKLSLVRHSPIKDSPISLVATFNHDTMLPIASFAKRINGQCSYMQLGQEIEEDKLVATPGAPRTGYVEAIRALLVPDNYLSKEQFGLIEDLVKGEIDKYRKEIDANLAPAVCRLAEQYIKQTDNDEYEKKEIYVLNGADGLDTGLSTKYLAREITFASAEDGLSTLHGRNVRLFLGRRLTGETYLQAASAKKGRKFLRRSKSLRQLIDSTAGNLQLIAQVRGDIGLSLVQFSESGAVSLDNHDQPVDGETLGYLMKILPKECEDNRRAIQGLKSKYVQARKAGKSVYTKSGGGEITVASSGARSGFGSSSREYNATVSWGVFREAIKADYRLPDAIEHAFRGTDDTNIQNLCAHLNVAEQLDSYLGYGDSKTEKLIASLCELVAKNQLQFEGVLKHRRAGKTLTDVDTRVNLTNGNGRLRVHVQGRPVALDGFDHATLFDETLLLDDRNEIDPEKVKEIAEVIGAICISKS